MFYTSIGCYDAILIQKLYFAGKHQCIMCCTNLYMHVCTLIYTEATYKSQTLTSLTLNKWCGNHTLGFSASRSRMWHMQLLNGQCYPQTHCVHFELIYTENWPNNPSADVIIEEDQSFPPGSEHKYWWFHHLYYVISMTFLCQCWLSLT